MPLTTLAYTIDAIAGTTMPLYLEMEKTRSGAAWPCTAYVNIANVWNIEI